MARRATSLGPKPSVFCFFPVVFSGGFQGQVKWPEGPPHLALNPSYLFMFFCFCWFYFFFPLFIRQKMVHSLKHLFCLFVECLSCFHLNLVPTPLLTFLLVFLFSCFFLFVFLTFLLLFTFVCFCFFFLFLSSFLKQAQLNIE